MTHEFEYPEGITPELLMAYADGALEPAEAARIEAVIAEHPELSDEVASFRLSSEALSGAFDAPLDEDVPDHLRALVMGETQAEKTDAPAPETGQVLSLEAARVRRSWISQPWGQAIAAGFVFAFGTFFGGVLGGGGSEPASDDTSLIVAGLLPQGHPVADALETAASSQIVNLPGGRFDAIATFQTADGEVCREFETAGETGANVAIACRDGGDWRVEVLLAAEPRASGQGGFQLASGFDADVLENVLDGLGAGTGLGAQAETCLINAGWDATQCENSEAVE